MTPRERLLRDVVALLPTAPHPLRVGVDGITAAGKSTFAAELTDVVALTGRPAHHFSTDGYHHLSAVRHSDPDPARGYYRDAFDLDAFRLRVLDPLGPGGDRWVLARRHELEHDRVLPGPLDRLPVDAVVVVDGSFLQARALRGAWDVVIWLEVPFETALKRAVDRDRDLMGSPQLVRKAYHERYHAACRLYLAETDPRRRADVVVDNAVPAKARLLSQPEG